MGSNKLFRGLMIVLLSLLLITAAMAPSFINLERTTSTKFTNAYRSLESTELGGTHTLRYVAGDDKIDADGTMVLFDLGFANSYLLLSDKLSILAQYDTTYGIYFMIYTDTRVIDLGSVSWNCATDGKNIVWTYNDETTTYDVEWGYIVKEGGDYCTITYDWLRHPFINGLESITAVGGTNKDNVVCIHDGVAVRGGDCNICCFHNASQKHR